MDGIRRFPLSFLLPLWILGCFLSSSNAIPLSQESNGEFEYGDLDRAGFRAVPEGFDPTLPPSLKSRYRQLQEEPASTDIPVVQSRYRNMEEQMALIPESKPTRGKPLTSEEVGYRKNLMKVINGLFDLFLSEIKDDEKWEYVREIILKFSQTVKKGLDVIGELSIFE